MTNPTNIQQAQAQDHRRAMVSRIKPIQAVRTITRSWRDLTDGGAPTLVACSGGADSVALALALWSAGAQMSLGHIVHDLRSEREAHADRDYVNALADRLGCPFLVASIQVAGKGNDEGVARIGRYGALATMARESDAQVVASAHHADDQLESMLMAIARGSGLDGLAGIAPSRMIGEGVTLIRPMLAVLHTDAEEICRISGVEWVHDLTNDDTSRFRSAVRKGPARSLTEIRPGAPAGAVRVGDLLRDAALLVEDRVSTVFGKHCHWERASLRPELSIVLGAGLRAGAIRLSGGTGADQLTRRVIDPVVRAIRDESTDPRHFHWPNGIEVEVTAHRVGMIRIEPPKGQGQRSY